MKCPESHSPVILLPLAGFMAAEQSGIEVNTPATVTLQRYPLQSERGTPRRSCKVIAGVPPSFAALAGLGPKPAFFSVVVLFLFSSNFFLLASLLLPFFGTPTVGRQGDPPLPYPPGGSPMAPMPPFRGFGVLGGCLLHCFSCIPFISCVLSTAVLLC